MGRLFTNLLNKAVKYTPQAAPWGSRPPTRTGMGLSPPATPAWASHKEPCRV